MDNSNEYELDKASDENEEVKLPDTSILDLLK